MGKHLMFARIFALALAAWVGCEPAMAQTATVGGGGSSTITGPVGPSTAPSSALSTTDTGTPITGQTLLSGGQGLTGWLSTLNSTATGPIPAQTSHGVNIGGVEGVSGGASTASENPLFNGARAATTEPTAVTDGQKVGLMATTSGKLVNIPYAPPALQWRATGNSTVNTATTFSGSSSATLKTYLTAIQCGRTDTANAPISVAINDNAGSPVLLTTLVVPNSGGGGGNNVAFPVPLVSSTTNLSLTFTPSSATTTVYCSAQGYFAP